MFENPKTQTSDQRAYLFFQRDGLLEIFIGLGALIFGLGLLLDVAWIGAILPATLFPIWPSLKQAITAPRLRDTELSPAEGAAARRSLVMTTITLTVTALLGLLLTVALATRSLSPQLRVWLSENFVLVLGVLGAALFAAFGLALQLRRFLGFAALTLLAFAAARVTRVALYAPFLLVGTAVLLIGLVTLVDFLRSHPKGR